MRRRHAQGNGRGSFALSPRARLRELLAVALASMAVSGPAQGQLAGTGALPRDGDSVQLSGHLLAALAHATPATRAEAGELGGPPVVLTVVLAREDQVGFDALLADLYDPASPQFHRFLDPESIADRFGPSRAAYGAVEDFLVGEGFALVSGSRNRLTLTAAAPREVVERTFDVEIRDFELDGRSFHANTGEPLLPAAIAPHVLAVVGMANLAAPQSLDRLIKCLQSKGGLACFKNFAVEAWNAYQNTNCATKLSLILIIFVITILFLAESFLFWTSLAAQMNAIYAAIYASALACLPLPSIPLLGPVASRQTKDEGGGRSRPEGLPGVGQRVGLVEFDTFHRSDVEGTLALNGYPPESIDRLSEVDVNGGAPAVGPGETEVLLDIAVVMTMAKGADVVVYSAPLATSFQTVFSQMIDDGVDVISNSWAYCEDQTSLADVESLDALFATAAAAGISVFNASGDAGSTCLDGSPDTVHVPASSPHATAVGGAKVVIDDDLVFQEASWWNDPETGAGGFGTSRYFPRPGFQDGLNLSTQRSVPDVVAIADPSENGLGFCQASKGGCPSGYLVGGTSMSAPVWAGLAALMNEASGTNLGFLNPALYDLAGEPSFHSPASLGTDFQHVGLGLPKLPLLHLALHGLEPGPADAAESVLAVNPLDVAVGDPGGKVIVQLRDVHGTFVPGKSVTLEANGGSVVIDPPVAISSDADGTAVFTITNTAYEDVTFTAHDTSDGMTVVQTGAARFVAPPPEAGGIEAFPTTVTANGTSTSTITVTIEDGEGNGTPGKEIRLDQGEGRSTIAGPAPELTDANGQVTFTVKSGVAEVVTYTAIDVTDGLLAVPGQAVITFDGSTTSCADYTVAAGSGYAIAPWARTFEPGDFSFGNVNWGGCPGVSQPAFHPSGPVFLTNACTGDVFRLGPDGGTVNEADELSNVGLSVNQPVIGKDGRLYTTRGSTGVNFDTGVVVELDSETGAVLRTLASGLKCPANLAVDPLSGDLFFTHICFGGLSEDPALHRIADPGGAATLSTYVTLPASPNGSVVFSPDGTLYVVTNYDSPTPAILEIAGTNQPQPPSVTTLAGVNSYFFLTLGEANPDGSAKSLVTQFDLELRLVDISEEPFVTTTLADVAISTGTVGPDGCLYSSGSDTVYRLSKDDGTCPFLPTSPAPTLTISPAPVAPSGLQGGTQQFAAWLRNVDDPEGTPVTFGITGANAGFALAQADANGVATLNLVGVFSGTDGVSAAATVEGRDVVSNRTQITWGAGMHVSELSLNASPESGFVGHSSTLVADLVDLSVEPSAPIVGATVEFSVGGEVCQDVTDVAGRASCSVSFDIVGESTLVATYAGDLGNLGATASIGFSIGSFGGSNLIFADDFETGDTDAWSGTFAPNAKIFADDFETGNLVRWSSSVPPA